MPYTIAENACLPVGSTWTTEVNLVDADRNALTSSCLFYALSRRQIAYKYYLTLTERRLCQTRRSCL